MDITEKHIQVICALYGGSSHKSVCEEMRIPPKTLKAWLEDAVFQKAMLEHATKQLGDLIPLAVRNLRGILEAEDTPRNIQLQAVKQVLELCNIQSRNALDNAVKVQIEYV